MSHAGDEVLKRCQLGLNRFRELLGERCRNDEANTRGFHFGELGLGYTLLQGKQMLDGDPVRLVDDLPPAVLAGRFYREKPEMRSSERRVLVRGFRRKEKIRPLSGRTRSNVAIAIGFAGGIYLATTRRTAWWLLITAVSAVLGYIQVDVIVVSGMARMH